MVRRWHLWKCCMGIHNDAVAESTINYLKNKGYPAKVFAPLPNHKTSGHIHVVILIDKEELHTKIRDAFRDGMR